jgi:CRP-like cAMP-binding protein
MSPGPSHHAAGDVVSAREGWTMASDPKLQALSSVKLFSQCSKRELRTIARLCIAANRGEGFVLTTQGSPGRECFVIVDGEADVQIDGRTVAAVGPGDCVGELALLDGGRRTATVVARTPMQLYTMTAAEFRALLETSPDVSHKIMVSLAQRLRRTEADQPH